MYGEDRQAVQRVLELAEENNKMLRRLQRARRWGMFISLTKWLFIVAAALGLYYYLQPLLERWPTVWQELQDLMDTFDILNQQA